MEGAKNFSIDALLAKDPTPRRACSPASPAMSSPNRHSPDSHKSNSFSPHSPDMGRPGSPAISSPASSPNRHHMSPVSSIHGGIVPRPGLLNVQHPSLGAAALAHGMLSGHAGIYPYGMNGGMSHAGSHHPMMGSAFHMPHMPQLLPDQAIKAAQMHGVPLEWFARTGMFLPRPMDYSGMSTITFNKKKLNQIGQYYLNCVCIRLCFLKVVILLFVCICAFTHVIF